MTGARAFFAFVLAAALGCAGDRPASRSTATSPRRPEVESALTRLRAHETRLRRETRLEAQAPSSRALGANPYRLCPVGDGAVGVLRGSSELVWLDAALRERARVPAPPSPSDCAVTERGEILVASELVSELSSYAVSGDTLVRRAPIPLPDGARPRALAARGDRVFAADGLAGTLLELEPPTAGRRRAIRTSPLCRGPFALEATAHHLAAACLLDHAVSVRALDRGGAGAELARIVHDGPFWGLDAAEHDGALLVAAGGVENRPLERVRGQFGYVDSFVYVYRVADGAATLLHAVNAADSGVLTPKALAFRASASGALRLSVAGYGGDAFLELGFARDVSAPLAVRKTPAAPGSAALVPFGAGFAVANPLLDAWIRLRDDGSRESLERVPSSLAPPSSSVRLGEALFFTRLIAPWAESTGKKSRFTCETCHFEGGVDGRVHYSGRGDVRVSTKPLFGLLNNRPFFSRAMDADLTSVSHHEFRVAGLGNPYDPWFSVRRAELPWLSDLLHAEAREEPLDGETLRRALLDFLAVFHHEPNPWVQSRTRFTALERDGAAAFEARCERCHAARLLSDEASSRVETERWEALVFSDAGPIVWARGDYEKSGIVPYVHERGTRVPSLRRLVRKWPYFTNGSARSLDEVLARAAWTRAGFFHDAAPAEADRLGDGERRAIAAFLRLL